MLGSMSRATLCLAILSVGISCIIQAQPPPAAAKPLEILKRTYPHVTAKRYVRAPADSAWLLYADSTEVGTLEVAFQGDEVVNMIFRRGVGGVNNLGQLLERPSRPFPRAGQAWPARILRAGVIYHVKEQIVYLGVDVAKAYLDAAIGKEKRRLPNAGTGHRELIKWIKQMEGPVQVICEPSGGYERRFIQALIGGQIRVSLVQANRMRQFARAAGILAKTDTIDARVLCAFGEAMRPQTLTASKLEQELLRELESQRRHLSRLLVMEQNRGARLSDSLVRSLNRALIKQIQ